MLFRPVFSAFDTVSFLEWMLFQNLSIDWIDENN